MSTPIEAGFGKVDISPRIGVELCGYGAYINRHSTRLLEPLHARALAVRQGNERWVLVSCDLIGLSPALVREIRQHVHEQTGWHEHEIMVHATHTHSAPCTATELMGWGDPDLLYLELLPRFVAKACVEAIQDLDAATFSHAEVAALGFSYNREIPAPARTNALVLAGKWMTDFPEETDTTAHVIRVERQGRVAGFLSYFSCHPVVAGALNREIHGDFVGIATNQVERQYPGATGLFLQGALGDINSNFVHGQPEETLQALQDFGSRFANVILEGLRTARPLEITGIRARLKESPYHLASVTEEELRAKLARHEAELSEATPSSDDSTTRLAMVYIRSLRAILGNPKKPGFLPAQTFTLGPVSFTGLPLELMHRIKRRFQAERGELALLLSVTNGLMGYAPLREYYASSFLRYSADQVPYMLGNIPFTADFEDEVLSAALKASALESIRPSAF